jgi:hypothetical protein
MMNIANLEQYVESRNAWAKIFGNKELSLLNAKDRQTIANAIDADLSPENLTCDGEVRGAALQNKFNFLNRCAAELASIDPSVTFQEF